MPIPAFRDNIKSIFAAADSGRMMDILSLSTQADLGDWIEENNCLDDKFVVLIPTETRHNKDIVLYCLCEVDFSGDEPCVRAKITTGLDGEMPHDMVGCPMFRVGLQDLEIANG